MAVDTEPKRWSMLNLAMGRGARGIVFNPSVSGLSAIERATVLQLYGGITFAEVEAIILPPASRTLDIHVDDRMLNIHADDRMLTVHDT